MNLSRHAKSFVIIELVQRNFFFLTSHLRCMVRNKWGVNHFVFSHSMTAAENVATCLLWQWKDSRHCIMLSWPMHTSWSLSHGLSQKGETSSLKGATMGVQGWGCIGTEGRPAVTLRHRRNVSRLENGRDPTRWESNKSCQTLPCYLALQGEKKIPH